MKDDLHKKISTILLVEDNHDSIFMIQEAIKEIQSNIKLFIVDNGVDAMAFLHRCNAYKDAIRPDIILLDLNFDSENHGGATASVPEDTISFIECHILGVTVGLHKKKGLL